MITQETAEMIYGAYREIFMAKKILEDFQKGEDFLIDKTLPRLKDAFGRKRHLQLGIPSGENAYTLYRVSPTLAISIIKAHIAHKEAELKELNEQAKIELELSNKATALDSDNTPSQ